MQILPFNCFTCQAHDGAVLLKLTDLALRALCLLCGAPVTLHSYYPRHIMDLRGNKCIVLVPRVITVPADEGEKARTHIVLCDFILKFKRYTIKSFLLACRYFVSPELEMDLEFDRLSCWFESRHPRIVRYLKRQRCSFGLRLRDSKQALELVECLQPDLCGAESQPVTPELPADSRSPGGAGAVPAPVPSVPAETTTPDLPDLAALPYLPDTADQGASPRGVFRILGRVSKIWKSVPQALAKYFFCKQARYPVEVRLWTDHRLTAAPP